MREKDLYYEANASGFLLFYKHRCIGGTVGKEKGSRGAKGRRQKQKFIRLAEIQIKLILEGRGEKRYHDQINDIEASFERWRKR